MTDWAALLARERPRLFALAYRMLGSASAAEDVLQEAWLRVRALDAVATPAAMLTTVVTRLCLDALRTLKSERQRYVGPWLPEPVLDAVADDTAPYAALDARASLHPALLLLLERLSPLERAAFLLREAFDEDYADIARCLGRSEAACRQALRRARAHVGDASARRVVSRAEQDALLLRFLAAARNGDPAAVAALCAAEVTAVSDGGGVVRAARRVVRGRDAVSRFVTGLARKGADAAALPLRVNGLPAFGVWRGGALVDVVLLDAGPQGIRAVYSVLAPAKLAWLSRRAGGTDTRSA